jgi:hypothetical protein
VVFRPAGSMPPLKSSVLNIPAIGSDTNLALIEYDRFRAVCNASWLIFLSSQRAK